MKSYDVSRLPTMITLGYDGENNWRPNRFDCSSLLANHPNGTISLWLLPQGESQAFPVALERDGNTVVWTPLSEEMTSATGALQLVCTDGTDVGKSAVVMFRVDESILPGADHPAAVPSWATQVMEQYQDAVEHYPQIIDSTWHVWDVENETWEDTGVSAQGVDGEDGHSPYIALNGHWMVYSDSTHEWIDTGVSASVDEAVIANAVAAYLDEHPITVTETDPTVPAWAKNPTKPTYTAQEVGALPADTPIPAAVTEQTVAGWGFTKNSGTYSKPSGGIPKTDLASSVQTSLGKADTALQEHQSLADYAIKSKLPYPNRAINIGHRGALPGTYPENTAPAFAAAAKLGFDYAEFDVRATSDGVLVCLHDATINRVARNADGTTISGGDINIADITYAQAQNYVFCSTHYAAYPTIRICTVEDAIKTCAMCGIGCWFDFYIEPTTTVLNQIFGWLDAFNMRDRSVFNSATYNYVAAIKAYDPAIALSTRSSTYSNLEHALSGIGAFDTGKNRIFVNVRQASMPTYAPAFHARGWYVLDSTLNPMSTMDEYASYLDAVLEEDFLFSDEIADYIMENSGQASTPLLNLNRTASQNQSAWYNEAYYLNPAQYQYFSVPSESLCGVADMTESSITVTENGQGGRGCAFPIAIADYYGKTLKLRWTATGTTNTRFRLMGYTQGGSGGLKHILIDNTGTKSEAIIAISADGKSVSVDGTAMTKTNEAFSHVAFFFGAATSTTVAYSGVTLTEQ